MSQILQPFNERARVLADYAQPVIVALGSAGLTGGAMAALGMVADRAWRSRRSPLA